MKCQITIQIDGDDVLAGTLFSNVRRGTETSTFSYDPSYLADHRSFALAPDMPLTSGPIHSSTPMFRLFADAMPDRRGRNLMTRAERLTAREEKRSPRTLFEYDMLLGVNDKTRQGALRFWVEDIALAPPESGVPREVSIPALLSSADRAAHDMDADIRDLLAAGSSLGGARPKASICDERGSLQIAKFPKTDESALDDTCAWEFVVLNLASKCGIRVPKTRLLRVDGRAVLLVERFDRQGEKRTPYMSGITAVQGKDGEQYSYLELIDFLDMEGCRPQDDMRELWLRILFNCAIGNTDDHMRNHGFLHDKQGWRLSPLFDVNPTRGDNLKYLSTAIDFDAREALPEVAFSCCEYFRVKPQEARDQAHAMASVLRAWRKAARRNGISSASVESMASCFDAGVKRLEQL